MLYTCANSECWDSIAYKLFGDEMLYPQILSANPQYKDVISFEGGEILNVPDSIVVDNVFITKPNQTGASLTIISAPWG